MIIKGEMFGTYFFFTEGSFFSVKPLLVVSSYDHPKYNSIMGNTSRQQIWVVCRVSFRNDGDKGGTQ